MRRFALAVLALMLAAVCAAQAEETAQGGEAMGYLGECFRWDDAREADLRLPEMVPVYAAPSEDAWRGANGKAAVSLTEPFTLLGSVPDSNWMLIEYEVSRSERRMGYIQWGDNWPRSVGELSEAGIGITLSRDTVLTDDPRASGRAMARLSGGDTVIVLGCIAKDQLYVETMVDGKAARGMIQASAAQLPEMTRLPDVMRRLEGVWGFSGGAEVLGEGIIFTADGSLLICDTDDYMETPPTHLMPFYDRPFEYAVYPTHPEDKRFWSEAVIVLGTEEGGSVYGLSFYPGEEGEPERLHIESGPSGGFYARYGTEPTIDAREP